MKRSYVLDIEKQISNKWSELNYHNVEPDINKPKYFATFPYPYMNGYLHLGHGFTMCKVDFMCRYKKLCGHNVLFPFGFHCTGMPICGAAKRLFNELEAFGIEEIQYLPETEENKKLQYNILKSYNLSHDEIIKFTDPNHWLKYFPQKGLEDIKAFDTYTDLRRSFITTELNPFYDSFVKYQFNKLHGMGLLKHGVRQSVYSPTLDIQCQDHDRLKGEGVDIGEFMLREITLNDKYSFLLCVRKDNQNTSNMSNISNLCPNILLIDIDQTVLCEVSPSYYRSGHKKFICSQYLLQNIHAQDIMTDYDNISNLSEIGLNLMLNHQINGTNIFKQVSSDSLQLTEIIKKQSFETVQVAKLFGYVCKFAKLPDKPLNEAVVQTETAILNMEYIDTIHLLNDVVIDRANSLCIVKPLPQWYIAYSDPQWKEKTIELVNKYNTSNSITKQTLLSNIAKLNDWGVSRQFGLGTHLPCDENELIDSLSDSTIYPAFYTVAHLIQSDIYGSSNLNSQDFTFAVWDYIFGHSEEKPQTNVSHNLLDNMRNSFHYWYPVDLRISGKDLLTNHLVMYLYNHAVMFKEEHFPKTIYANGWIMVDGKKMSKSEGNFITINQLIGSESIDSIRMTLADSGDGIDDANYVRSNASDSNLLKLYDWIKQIEDVKLKLEANMFRTSNMSYHFIDNLFNNIIKWQVRKTQIAYEEFKFRDVLIEMFYSYNALREKYRIWCKLFGLEPHIEIINLFNRVQTIYMNPIIPHLTEYVWINLLNTQPTELLKNTNPIYNFTVESSLIQQQSYDKKLISDYEIITDLIKQIQSTLSRNMKKKNYTFNKITIKAKFEEIDTNFIIELFSKLFGQVNGSVNESVNESIIESKQNELNASNKTNLQIEIIHTDVNRYSYVIS